ncbi:MAG: (Fe-S)-binding protein [Nitrospinae bacterium]|nr:(Fe-S)-binding protein [Nitrospinota bacterium]
MAKPIFDIPNLDEALKTPAVKKGASAHLKIHPAQPPLMEKLGFPPALVEGWQKKAVEKLGELKEKYKSLKLFMEVCVKCGSCADKCHYYLGTSDPNNMPVGRQELMRKVYRKNFTVGGALFGKLANAEEMDEETLKEWSTYFYQCSQCRRCSVFCPFGIDTAEITMAAREIMDSIGAGHKYSVEIIGKVHDVGNNLGIPKPALQSTLDFLEEDVKEATGADVKFPLDQEGADVLFITPSADFFSSPHVDSLVGYAKVFHAAGIGFTFSSHASEFANFGMFVGNYDQMKKISERIVQAARDLKVKRIIVGECGHAWRVAYSFWETLNGPFDFLDVKKPMHVCEFTHDLIKKGALTFDKTANDEFTVTYHDSCNVARASRMGDAPGGQFEIPREILRAVCNKYVEMPDAVNRQKTFCCGGGGGLLTDELMELRVKGAAAKTSALKTVMQEKGVNTMAMICAICKAQFSKVLPYYEIPMETVAGIHQLVSNAIRLGEK